MLTMLSNLRHGLRVLAKSPGYTAVAVIILALGIGASTAIFSVLYAAVLRPLPYDHPDQIVMIYRTGHNSPQMGVSGLEFMDWEKQSSVFSALTIVHHHDPAITESGANERLDAYRVTPGFFKVFGAQAAEGRLFAPGDDQPGRDRSVVLGSKFQASGPGRDSAVIGGKLVLDREDHAVLGRVPASFQFPAIFPGIETDPEAYVSQPLDALAKGGRQNAYLWVFARLKPGVSIGQAQAQMATIAAREAQQYPDTNTGVGIRVVPLRQQVNGFLGGLYEFLLGAVGLLLLLACVNVAVLLLAQGARRQQEIAIRQAVGASRARVATQLLTESILLALAGGAAGVLLAYWFKAAMLSLSPPLLIPKTYPITINGHVLAFTLLVSVLTGILFGFIPALQLSKVNLQELLKEGAHAAGTGMRTLRARNVLVVAEVALALSLLIVCGLMIRSLAGALFAKPQGDPRKMIVAGVTFPIFKYPQYDALNAFFQNLLEQISALPGVEAAALQRSWGGQIASADNPVTATTLMESQFTPSNLVTQDYFRVMQLPLLQGRLFTPADYIEKPTVMIINAALAHKFWPNQNALGKRLTTTYPPEWYEVVGVVADEHIVGANQTFPQVYIPKYNTYPQLVVRTSADAKGLIAPIRTLLIKHDKDNTVRSIETMEELRARSGSPIRYIAAILITMAVIALLLATIGVYAVTAYSISQRSHEIGIRMALGAQRGKVLLLVMRQGMLLSFIGIVIGLLLVPVLSRVLATFLRGLVKIDVLTYAAVSLLFLLVTLLASYLPSRRATKIDPAAALRCE